MEPVTPLTPLTPVTPVTTAQAPPVSSYREFAPHPALRELVRSFFSFAPYSERATTQRCVTIESTFGSRVSFFSDSPQFADGGTSIVFELGRVWQNGRQQWVDSSAPRGHVIGAMTRAGPTGGDAVPEMIGAFLRPGLSQALTRALATDLTNRVVSLDLLWGSSSGSVGEELSRADEASRVELFESHLLRRVATPTRTNSTVDVPAVAAWIVRQSGCITVGELARLAGVSRQHLTRVFRQRVGVSPKRFCRLARFHASLAFAGRDVDWARVAAELGYSDQSHLIADFRAFSGMTPEALSAAGKYHPFIEKSTQRRYKRL